MVVVAVQGLILVERLSSSNLESGFGRLGSRAPLRLSFLVSHTAEILQKSKVSLIYVH